MSNDYTPLKQAATAYSQRMSGRFELPSAETLASIIEDAFTDGALWTLRNPVLTSDLRKKVDSEH